VEKVLATLMQTNVVGNIHLFNLFIPLVLKGKVKKVIAISTGLADVNLTNECDIDIAPLYAASKGALNVIVAKFNAQYKKDGVLFMSISPGLVEVGRYDNCKHSLPSALQTLPPICSFANIRPSYPGRDEGDAGIRGQPLQART
jgi:short-subunit dehydrogenase involved in D-alanine esterification of teichoic acids